MESNMLDVSRKRSVLSPKKTLIFFPLLALVVACIGASC
jgi:hypothetical protein